MPTYPPDPVPGSPVSASWMRRMLAASRASMPLAGPGVRISYTPNGAMIEIDSAPEPAKEPPKPFEVRWHEPAGADGQWEIYLPHGCISCGWTCQPANVEANDTQGHGGEDGEPRWYILPVNESQGQSQTDADGNSYRVFDVTIHAKPYAKIDGEDEVDSNPRRLAFATTWPRFMGQNSSAVDVSAIGDEFSQIVAEIKITDDGQGKIRTANALVSSPISVQAHVQTNFDLEFWFSRDNYAFAVDSVYSIRNTIPVAGAAVVGDSKINVTAAFTLDDEEHEIVAVIRSNSNNPEENIIEVQVDPTSSGNTGGNFTTNLGLYTVTNGIIADFRNSALTNIQILR